DVMQRIVGNVVRTDVAPDVCGRPSRQWVVFHDGMINRRKRRIILHCRNVHARDALVATLTCDPRIESRQVAAQRLDLANGAALLMAVAVKAEESLAANEILDVLRIRRQQIDANSIVVANALYEAIGLRMQTSRIE